ncbi:MAG: MotA/TolQ/ExbB proton channel family protein [Verrucomicrobia bacterium]|nr:MotA/TolQ/ExbB proton channel family protein [Verrucomicrobiota bacterium]
MLSNPTIAGIVQFFAHGGPFMVLLVLLSILSLTSIILRARRLRAQVVLPSPVAEAAENFTPGASLGLLRAAIVENPSALSRILATLLSHTDWSKSENLEAVQTTARHEMARLEKGLVILEIATGAGPLLGLLGTLSGLVGIFATLGGSGDPVLVARGISEALNTTIVGLAVAVPSLTAHSYFQRRIEMAAVEMESIAGDLLAKLYQPATRR